MRVEADAVRVNAPAEDAMHRPPTSNLRPAAAAASDVGNSAGATPGSHG